MKKGYSKAIIGIVISTCFLAGCGSQMPDMTKEQEKAVGEYAAILLLQHDANNRSRLVDLSLVETEAAKPEKEEPEEEQAAAEEGTSAETIPVTEVKQEGNADVGSMEAFWDLPAGVTIAYQEEKICESYPEEASGAGYFSLDAAEGKKLLVLQFQISNQSEEDEDICLMHPGAVYKVKVNGNTYNALTTMLMNDMTTYIDTLKAHETQEVVMLAEIAAEQLENVSDISLKLTNDAKIHTIQLK